MVSACLAVLVLSACTAPSQDDPGATATSSPSEQRLESLAIDWPTATPADVDWPEVPGPPDGFDAALLDSMAGPLQDWAAAAALDPEVWTADEPPEDVLASLGERARGVLEDQVADTVSPRLALGNVFDEEWEVVGEPRMTSAWDVETRETAEGPVVVLRLQTRTAYEVRSPERVTRVVGVVRTHGLSGFPESGDDELAPSLGWEEFGAAGCALALDDALVPDGGAAARDDLESFVDIGGTDTIAEPDLADEDTVDQEYLQRCRDGAA